jgi:hypothetical protein
MSGWEYYQTEVAKIAPSCAIISLGGVRCCANGEWTANTKEERQYMSSFNTQLKFGARLSYNGEVFMVARVENDFMLAVRGDARLLLKRGPSIIIGARYTSELGIDTKVGALNCAIDKSMEYLRIAYAYQASDKRSKNEERSTQGECKGTEKYGDVQTGTRPETLIHFEA